MSARRGPVRGVRGRIGADGPAGGLSQGRVAAHGREVVGATGCGARDSRRRSRRWVTARTRFPSALAARGWPHVGPPAELDGALDTPAPTLSSAPPGIAGDDAEPPCGGGEVAIFYWSAGKYFALRC